MKKRKTAKTKRRIDPDNPPLTDADFADMRPAHEVVPHIVEAARRGRPVKADKKQLVSLRIDGDILDAYRALGKGWQTKLNESLRFMMSGGNSIKKRSVLVSLRRSEGPRNFTRAPNEAKAAGKPKPDTHHGKR